MFFPKKTRTLTPLSSQLRLEICIKSENIVSLCLSFQKKIAWFKLAWNRSKVQFAPPAENIYGN